MDSKSSNKKDLLPSTSRKAKHLHRKPNEKSKSKQVMDGKGLSVNRKPVEKKMRYNLRKQTENAHGEQSEPMQPNGLNLMALDDDCLMELFEFMKPMELANCAYVNVRLNKLIKRHIQTKYKIRFGPNVDFNAYDQSVRFNLDDFQAFLRIYGEDIVTLTLRRSSFDDTFDNPESMGKILRVIQDHCHLKGMTLIGFNMCGLNEEFCSHLESLTLDDCNIERDWKKMKQLKILKLNQVTFRLWPVIEYKGMDVGVVPIPFDCFGALENVQLSDVKITDHDMTILIKSNRNIKSLSIVKCHEISPVICSHVSSSLENLEEYEYKTLKTSHKYHLETLSLLKKLKVLKLSHENICTTKTVDECVKDGIALEHLELGFNFFTAGTVVSIAKMPSLKILKLNENLASLKSESHITSMVNQLDRLEELQVKMKATISQNGMMDIVRGAKGLVCLKVDVPGFTLDVDTYQAMLAIIQGRAAHNRLELTIYGDGNQLAVPDEILNGQNEKWLTVKELNRKNHHLFEDLTSKASNPPPVYDDYSDYSGCTDDDSDLDDYYYC